jgi:hypothetical protein
MSNYVKATNFTAKDSLLTGNPAKIIKGAEIDDEFNAIATAVATKPDSNSPTFTGIPVAPTASAGTNTTQLATTAFVTGVVNTLGTMATQNKTAVDITGGTVVGITDLAVADGGTGVSTIAANAVVLGNGTSAIQTVAPGTTGNVLTSNGTTWTSAPSPISTGAGVLTASGQTFTITTKANGKCLINISAGFEGRFANYGVCTANLVIGGSTIASDTARTMEYDNRFSGDHAIIAYQYSGAANSSITVTFTASFPGVFTRAYYSFIGT